MSVGSSLLLSMLGEGSGAPKDYKISLFQLCYPFFFSWLG